MIGINVPIIAPKVTVTSNCDTKECRCTTVHIKTSYDDQVNFVFENIDDAKALHGLLGHALGVSK